MQYKEQQTTGGDMAKKITLESLGPTLKERRGGRGLREVAKEIGTSPATLSRIESGKQPDLETFSKLCKWLGVDGGEVLGCSESKVQQPTFARWHDDNSIEIAYLCEKFDWNKQSVLNHLFSLYRDGEISLDQAMSYLYKRDSVETALLSKQRDALTNRLKGYMRNIEEMAELLKGVISEVDEAELEAEPETSLEPELILDQQVYCYVDSETHSNLKAIVKRIGSTRDQVKGRDRITTSSLLRALIPLLDSVVIPDGEIQSNADLEKYIYDHFVTSVTK